MKKIAMAFIAVLLLASCDGDVKNGSITMGLADFIKIKKENAELRRALAECNPQSEADILRRAKKIWRRQVKESGLEYKEKNAVYDRAVMDCNISRKDKARMKEEMYEALEVNSNTEMAGHYFNEVIE